MNLLTSAIGFMVTGGVNSVFIKWIPDDLNDGHLEYIYFAMAALSFVTLVVFTFSSKSFVYKVHGEDKSREHHPSGHSPLLSRFRQKKLRQRALTYMSHSAALHGTPVTKTTSKSCTL